MSPSMTILQPVVALLIWSSIMWVWMYWTRIPAMLKAEMKPDPTLPSGVQMATLPARVRWKADNFNHLMEQPTLFYAVAFVHALSGTGDGLNLWLAWTYVAIRIVHSLFQALVNKIEVRFVIFILASLVLITLIVRAGLVVWA